MHIWGDKWFERHGDQLCAAQNYIQKYVKRWSRCNLISKEKWGSIRYEYMIPPKGHVCMYKFPIYAPWTKKYKHIEGTHRPLLWAWNSSWIYGQWQRWGWRMTKRAVNNAIIKWPCLANELMSDLASREEVVGKDIHDQFWSTYKGNEND